jgi:hypothetical protein
MRLNQGDQLILLSPLPPKDVETAIMGVSNFDAGMKLHQGVAADKWRKVYDSVESESSNAASNSLSSESLLVQVSRKSVAFFYHSQFFLCSLLMQPRRKFGSYGMKLATRIGLPCPTARARPTHLRPA